MLKENNNWHNANIYIEGCSSYIAFYDNSCPHENWKKYEFKEKQNILDDTLDQRSVSSCFSERDKEKVSRIGLLLILKKIEFVGQINLTIFITIWWKTFA